MTRPVTPPACGGRLLRAGAAISLTAAAIVLPPTAAAAAPDLGGFTVLPVATATDPVTRGYFSPTLRPGATRVDQVIITNQAARPINLIVSSVDGLTGQTSGSVFGNRLDPHQKAGAWLHADVSTLRLPAHARVTVGFSVTVPPGSLAGEHLAGLAVENADPATAGAGVEIRQVLRTVVGVLVTVPGPANFTPALSALRLERLPGAAAHTVVVRLGNTGAALGKPTLTVDLAGPDNYRRSVTRVLDTVLPGDAIAYPFSWPDALAPGQYDITITMLGDNPPTSAVITGAGTVVAPLDGTAPRRTPNPADPIPDEGARWGLLALVALAGMLGGGLIIGFLPAVRRRLRHRYPSPVDDIRPVYDVGPVDDVGWVDDGRSVDDVGPVDDLDALLTGRERG